MRERAACGQRRDIRLRRGRMHVAQRAPDVDQPLPRRHLGGLVPVTPILKALSPFRTFYKVAAWLGANTSMMQWKGRPPS